ncbi:MAG: hypothetical protein EZS28_003840 [Streblomastix strix]|uniref:Uncharacterized protein n=1 Tax=Streblomastix strix TaxID=222440 RepID=A0A5J4X020_9EUKA|nr:MAG: hypothetical protein EZS28_003840 [Streblomastix strix]
MLNLLLTYWDKRFHKITLDIFVDEAFNRKKFNNQAQLYVMQHAMVLLVAYSTMKDTQLHSMKRSEIKFDDAGTNIVILKKKAKKRGQQLCYR